MDKSQLTSDYISNLHRVMGERQRAKVMERYQDAIYRLRLWGFEDADVYASVGKPFSMFTVGLMVYMAAPIYHDITGMKMPFRAVLYYVLMRHHEAGTVTSITHGNPIFMSQFLDGTVLETKASYLKPAEYPNAKFYMYGIAPERFPQGLTFPERLWEGWQLHQHYLAQFRAEDYAVNKNLSDDVVQQMMNVSEDVQTYGERYPQKK